MNHQLRALDGQVIKSQSGRASYTVGIDESCDEVILSNLSRKQPSRLKFRDINRVLQVADRTLTPTQVDSILDNPQFRDSSTMCALVLALIDGKGEVPVSQAAYCVMVGEKICGPYTLSQLIALAREGSILADSLVRKGEDGEWFEARGVRGLQAHCAVVREGSDELKHNERGGILNEVSLPERLRPRSLDISINRRHNTRCHQCKSRIYALIGHIHGVVEHKFKATRVSVLQSGYDDDSKSSRALTRIYRELVSFRGYNQFVKSKTLQRCDLFVPAIGSVVELDEHQHFSAARAVAISNYPDWLDLGFDRNEYLGYCRQIDSKDNDPAFRDEQRAWYDTIRDFLPVILPGMVRFSTIRIPLGFHEWCSLDVNDPVHVEAFRRLTGI